LKSAATEVLVKIRVTTVTRYWTYHGGDIDRWLLNVNEMSVLMMMKISQGIVPVVPYLHVVPKNGIVPVYR
jgi:hypothetical protein